MRYVLDATFGIGIGILASVACFLLLEDAILFVPLTAILAVYFAYWIGVRQCRSVVIVLSAIATLVGKTALLALAIANTN